MTSSQEDESVLHAAVPEARKRSRFAWIGTALSLLIVAASVGVLWHLAQDISFHEVRGAFAGVTREQLGLAAFFVALSYLLLTFYDALALRQMKLAIPYRTAALASFTSYAVSFNLGFPLLTSGAVRHWVYSQYGITTAQVASLTVIAGLTFWLGMGVVIGVSLMTHAFELAAYVPSKPFMSQALGLGALIGIIIYFIWVSIKRRSVRIQGWRLELPGFRLSLGQTLLGIGDVCAGAAVLYVLLPHNLEISYGVFLAIYVAAVMLGVASHIPGGLGAFEATMLVALASLPKEPVLGALLLFRLCYYLIPFVLALGLLGAYEIIKRTRSLRLARGED